MSTKIKSESEWEAEGLGIAGRQLIAVVGSHYPLHFECGDLIITPSGSRAYWGGIHPAFNASGCRVYRKIPVPQHSDADKVTFESTQKMAEEIREDYQKACDAFYAGKPASEIAKSIMEAREREKQFSTVTEMVVESNSKMAKWRLEKGPCIPTDAAARKGLPVVTGVCDYFPLALLEIAKVSKAGNEQHNPGKPMFWDRSKSTDEADALGRHLLQRGTKDTDGQRHSAKLAWRALALLQKELESESPEKTTNG